jgi:CheY-like chemotaxis protein
LIAGVVEDLLGAQTVTASDGAEALQLVSEMLPHLVLLDLNMPVLDGYSVIRHLRENPRTGTLPIVAVTANGADGQKRALDLGADACLQKPFEEDDLMQVVCQYLPTRVGATSRKFRFSRRLRLKSIRNRYNRAYA